jgi:hypothetical protein
MYNECDEYLKLDQPILMEGTLDVWFKKLEDAMKSAVTQNILKALTFIDDRRQCSDLKSSTHETGSYLTKYNKKGFEEWIKEFPI